MSILRAEDQILRKIERAFPRRTASRLRLAIGDDAALFQPLAGHDLALTTDWFLEGTHFLQHKHPPESVGWKCLARAASDIAAMGGTPRCFLVSLALPAEATGAWLGRFLTGLRRAAKALHCELAGGDTTKREEILINVTVVGEVPSGRAVRRAGAREGDLLYVTGTLGEAELGLRMFLAQEGDARAKNLAMQKHFYPVPRIAVGRWLAVNRLASAMMDLSDGLSADLGKFCAASGVGARIEAEKLPVSSLPAGQDALALALGGGDDYELLFSIRPGMAKQIPQKFRGVALTRVGEITAGRKIELSQGKKTRALRLPGWDPFKAGSKSRGPRR